MLMLRGGHASSLFFDYPSKRYCLATYSDFSFLLLKRRRYNIIKIVMKKLDLKGLTCPAPVIETKKALEKSDIREIEVLVDNSTSCENVRRYLESQMFSVTVDTTGSEYIIRGIRKETKNQTAGVQEDKILVFIDSETMGRGSDELGKILMRSFLNTLKEIAKRPWRIIFVNSGVKIAVEGSEYLSILKNLEELGIEILSCGTCLDYFMLKDKVAAGRVSNMFEIVSSFTEATKVIKP